MSTQNRAGGQFAVAVTATGALIRYSFYFVGAIVLGGIGLLLLWFWGTRVTVVDGAPAFNISGRSVPNLPKTSTIIAGSQLGRVEVLQFGTVHNRETDLTVAMAMPAKGVITSERVLIDFREANLMRTVR